MKIISKLLAVAVVAAMSVSVSIPAFAVEDVPDAMEQPVATVEAVGEDSEGIMPLTIVDSGVVDGVGTGYKTIVYKPEGVGGKLTVKIISNGYNGWTGAMDVILQNKSGNTVYQKENIAGVSADFSLDCGWDVVRVELRIRPKIGAWDDVHHTVAWYIER